jgi:hypothetical protein
MPDISMCSGEKCPLKENCYRFLAIPNEFRQSYFMNPPYNHQTNECEYFWDNYLYQKIKDENKIED